MVGERNRADAFDSEHPNFLAQVAMADQIQAAGGVPEKIWIDLAAAGVVAGSGIVAHLGGASLVDGLRYGVDCVLMLSVTLVRAEADGEYLLHPADIFVSLGRQGRRHFVQGRVKRRLNLGPV